MLKSADKTRFAFVWSNILNAPLWALFNMLPFILFKDMHATQLEVTAIIILKPASSLFALYWSTLVEKRADRLLSNLIWARILSHLPFFFFPFVDNTWFFIASFGFYMMLTRGTLPAWMEVLKQNIPGTLRERVFAYGSMASYLGSALIPFALGGIMDAFTGSWRWMFPLTAMISLTSVLFKIRIPITLEDPACGRSRQNLLTPPICQALLKPWKSAWELISRRKDFARYQLGFMLGGSGLIIMQPALPVFFMDGLHLSYTELAVALTLCKGLGYAITSPTWARLMSRVDVYRFNSLVTLLAFIFPFFLLAAKGNLAWLYGGYILYGVMQAGSEMSWHLSGPLFAKDEDSSVYSSINVLTVGLRGCLVPAIGSLLVYVFHASGVMLVGALLCLSSAIAMSYYSAFAKTLTERR